MHDAVVLLRHEVALAKHELRAELRHIMLAVLSRGVGGGIAAIGGWLLILLLVHLLQAPTALPLWACYGIVGGLFAVVGGVLLMLGKQKLARMRLVPQDTNDLTAEDHGQPLVDPREPAQGPKSINGPSLPRRKALLATCSHPRGRQPRHTVYPRMDRLTFPACGSILEPSLLTCVADG
jgi:Putative Actinobacterial Holin-X, holin superfamily III